MQKRHVLRKASGLVMGSSMLLLSMMPAASAFAATAPTLSLVAGQGISAQVGSNLTYTATVSGLANAEYQFWVEEPNGQWVVGQNYSTNNTFTLSNVQQGNYLVEAYAMTPSEIKAGDWSSAVASNNGESLGAFVGSTVTTNVVVSGTTTPATDVQPGTNITATASSTGVYDAMYQFWVKYPDGTWTQSGPYTTSDTYTFTAPVAGNYEVVAYAKSPQGLSDPAAALMSNEAMPAAYGSAASVKLSPSSSTLVADGQATDTVTATVVDSNGNTVADYNGTLQVSYATGSPAGSQFYVNGAGAGMTTQTVNVTNGVATFQLVADTVPGLADTLDTAALTPTGGTAASVTYGTTTVTTVPQVATAVKVTAASPKIEVNTSTGDTVSAEVVDQNGVPMLTGSYSLTFNATGPGQFADGTAGPETTVFTGNGSATNPIMATETIYSETGVAGTINVSAASSGLQSGSAAITAAVAGNASTVSLSDATPSFAEGSTGTTLTAAVTDANGTPVLTTDPTVQVAITQNGVAASNITVNGATNSTATYSVPVTTVNGASQASIVLADTNAAADAGTYTVTVSSPSGASQTLTAQTFTVTETAAAASKIVTTGAAAQVAEANPTTTVTAQVEDQYGNKVAQAGVPVSFSVTGNGSGTATVNGSSTSTTPVVVDTNAQGVASATVTMQPYAGETYDVSAWVPSTSGYTLSPNSLSGATPVPVTVESTIAAAAKVTLTDSTGSTTTTTAGHTVSGTIQFTDQYGNPVAAQSGTITVTGGLTGLTGTGITATGTANQYAFTEGSATSLSFTATAGTEGTATVSATDTTVSPNSTGQASIYVNPGAQTGYAFFNSQGQLINATNELTVAANTPTEVWLKPVDG
ncbi:MAG: beta strand repeat-containing protein, partial [Sulfobacillus sp.]